MVLGLFKVKPPPERGGGFANLEQASAPWRGGLCEQSQGEHHAQNLFRRLGHVP